MAVVKHGPKLALIVGAARSGTTLLRLIVDAHPEIGCPAEAGLPGLMSHMAGVWMTIDADVAAVSAAEVPAPRHRTEPDGRAIAVPATEDSAAAVKQAEWLSRLPPEAEAWIGEAMDTAMSRYCVRGGKRLYVDKSLDSVHHLPLVHRLCPEARYVLLFRHVMDTVASGIEASPWGFQAYGYLPFVQHSPDNFVAALVNYWLSHVEAAVKWQQEHSELCLMVRYEDLVTDPERVVRNIFSFLDVEWDPTVFDRAFSHARSASGPGDYKVTFTSKVDSSSVGHGKRIPIDMVPPALLERANEQLKALGYAPLNRSWNAEPAHAHGVHDSDRWGARLSELMDEVRAPALDAGRPMDSFALVAQDDEQMRWIVDLAEGRIRQGDGEVECVITGTTEDLESLLSGRANAGSLLRSGRIRHLSADGDRSQDYVLKTVQLILDTLGDGKRTLQRASNNSR